MSATTCSSSTLARFLKGRLHPHHHVEQGFPHVVQEALHQGSSSKDSNPLQVVSVGDGDVLDRLPCLDPKTVTNFIGGLGDPVAPIQEKPGQCCCVYAPYLEFYSSQFAVTVEPLGTGRPI